MHAIVIVVIVVIVVIDARALVQQLLQQLLRLLSNVLEQRRLCRELHMHLLLHSTHLDLHLAYLRSKLIRDLVGIAQSLRHIDRHALERCSEHHRVVVAAAATRSLELR